MSSNKEVVVNGEKKTPIKKVKVPRDVDWQQIAKEKQDKKD